MKVCIVGASGKLWRYIKGERSERSSRPPFWGLPRCVPQVAADAAHAAQYAARPERKEWRADQH